jgi:outer membrane murein-binding lipoprotein Lpp
VAIDMRRLLTQMFIPRPIILRSVVVATFALAGCATEEKTSCAAGDGVSSLTLTAEDCKQVQAAFDAQKAQQAASVQAAAAARQRAVDKYRTDVAARMRADERKGFKATSIENFKLYGQDLAHHDAKVSVQGVYVKTTRGEFLMPSSLATSQVDVKRTPDEGVNLLSKSASRAAKRAFAECQKDTVQSKLGCPITVVGEAVLCDRTTIFGVAQAPCIAVDDSWYVSPPG